MEPGQRNSIPEGKRTQAQLDDTDEGDAQRNSKRRKLKSTSEYIYETLFINGENSDVTVCALGHEWLLHRVFLLRSAYFRSVFSDLGKQTLMDRIKLDIPDENVTAEGLTIAFGSLYRDDILIDPCTVASLLSAASLLKLDDLIQQCAIVMMWKSIDIGTVCSSYTTGRMYGAKDVPEKCIKYLQGSLMPNMTVQLLKDIEPELMTHLIDGVDLFVLQVEMDVYTMLRKWIYLRLHPNYEGTLKELIQDTDAFIKSEVASSWRPSFLESPQGAPFINVFSKLRIEHILTDHSSAKILESDGIVPHLWVLNCYRSQWLQLLRVDNGQDSRRIVYDKETFEKRAMRCGMKLDTKGHYCWRWTGFMDGIDIFVIYFNHCFWLSRRIPSGDCLVAMPPRKHIIYRLTMTTTASVTDDLPSFSRTTGIQHLSLRKDEEVCVLTVDRKITFPLFISCNFLLYTPEPTTPKDPPVADVAAAVVSSPQPLPGPSVQDVSS